MVKQRRILVAEDEETDVFFLRQAFRAAGLPHELIVTQDGKEAVEYLSGEVPDPAGAQRSLLPDLVLLDLKMPRMTGFEVLAWLQSRADLRKLPAVVLTSSSDEEDRQRAQQLGAVAYLVKPDSLDGLVELVQGLQRHFSPSD